MKKVLITGANSYIGTSFEAWAKEKYPEEFEIDTIDMVDGSWRETRFAGYDAVFHVAGIALADVGHVSDCLLYTSRCVSETGSIWRLCGIISEKSPD